MIQKLFKRLTGLDKVEEAKAEATRLLAETEAKLEEARRIEAEAKDAEENAKLTPKQRATKKKEPWVAVLDTHVNKENVRNGFFELDWNEYFVLQLKQDGYGADGDKDEEIVDRWFRELCANVVVDGDYGGPVQTGTLDVGQVLKENK